MALRDKRKRCFRLDYYWYIIYIIVQWKAIDEGRSIIILSRFGEKLHWLSSSVVLPCLCLCLALVIYYLDVILEGMEREDSLGRGKRTRKVSCVCLVLPCLMSCLVFCVMSCLCLLSCRVSCLAFCPVLCIVLYPNKDKKNICQKIRQLTRQTSLSPSLISTGEEALFCR
jgi:hypothetical protein